MSRTRLAFLISVFVCVAACGSGDDSASEGTYTIQFPSTAAAVATDTVQVLLFDLPEQESERATFCEQLIQGRKRRDPQKPSVLNPPVNICEMLLGKKPIRIPYGERAVFAIAQRRGADFMLGCAIQTIGDGDAPLPIAMSLMDISNAVPDTPCSSVGAFCRFECPAL